MPITKAELRAHTFDRLINLKTTFPLHQNITSSSHTRNIRYEAQHKPTSFFAYMYIVTLHAPPLRFQRCLFGSATGAIVLQNLLRIYVHYATGANIASTAVWN